MDPNETEGEDIDCCDDWGSQDVYQDRKDDALSSWDSQDGEEVEVYDINHEDWN